MGDERKAMGCALVCLSSAPDPASITLCLSGCALLYGDGWIFDDLPEPSETATEGGEGAATNGGEDEQTAANGGEASKEPDREE